CGGLARVASSPERDGVSSSRGALLALRALRRILRTINDAHGTNQDDSQTEAAVPAPTSAETRTGSEDASTSEIHGAGISWLRKARGEGRVDHGRRFRNRTRRRRALRARGSERRDRVHQARAKRR